LKIKFESFLAHFHLYFRGEGGGGRGRIFQHLFTSWTAAFAFLADFRNMKKIKFSVN
jgi:hypothetical protein